MNNSFNYQFFHKLLLVLFLLALLPFLVLCFYVEPSADDYTYAVSLSKDSFMNIQIHRYLHWGSRYTATAILIINPIYFGWFSGYNLISFLMIALFVAASFYLFTCITENKKLSLLLTAFFVFSYLFMLPDITSAFYWLAGSATYHFANILSLLFIGFWIKTTKSNSLFYKVALFVLIFLIIGCNEVSMIYIDLFIFIVLLYSLLTQKKIDPFYFSLFIWAGVLTLFILLAPGNSVRSESVIRVHTPLLINIINSLRKSIVVLIRYGFLVFLINFLVFYAIRDQLIKLNLKLPKSSLYLYFLLLIVFLFLGSFPSLWSVGIYPPLRTVNVLFFVTLLFSMIINYKIVTLPIFSTIKLSQLFLSITLLLLIFSYIFAFGNKSILNIKNNLYFAYSDIVTGEAAEYKEEMEERYKLIQNSKEDTIYVKPLQSNPQTILYSELSQDPTYFYNQAMAEFFNKKVIILK